MGISYADQDPGPWPPLTIPAEGGSPYTGGVLSLPPLRHWLTSLGLFPAVPSAETARLIIGSTGSGKSEGELVELVRIADRKDYAIVLLDGHGPLAFRAAGHWVARGHEHRLLYEPLKATDRVLAFPLYVKSSAATPAARRIEDAETRAEIAQCFLAERNLLSSSHKPWTHEWMHAAIRLVQAQPQPQPIETLLDAFRVGTPGYDQLLGSADDAAIVAKFRGMEQIRRRNLIAYETETGPARRLLELLCESEVIRLRARPGAFDWLTALRERKLIAFDGGDIRSPEIKRTFFLLASLQTIHAVRRHFAERRTPLPVVLVLEEAAALGLVSPFVRTALLELRKAGLAIHILGQASQDFGDGALVESLLASTPWQAFYQLLSPTDQELGAKVLGNPSFNPLEVHFTRTRLVPDGVSPVETVSRGTSSSPGGGTRGHEIRTGTAFKTRYRTVTEPQYKSPQLHEQELRTALATLAVGERLVRDRQGVRRERVKLLKTPRLKPSFEDATRAAIARIRQPPLYQPPPPEPRVEEAVRPAAAALLRERAAGRATNGCTSSAAHRADARGVHGGG